MFVFIKETS